MLRSFLVAFLVSSGAAAALAQSDVAAASARVLGPEAHREGACSRLSLCETARERDSE